MKTDFTVTNEYGCGYSEEKKVEMDLNVLGNTWMQI